MEKIEIAVFAGGCFWCTEAIFKRLKGVKSVIPGYTGGNTRNPYYGSVSEGNTGHYEAVRIEFNPTITSYKELLDVFFKTHDPTQIGGQGADIGSQYQSAIFYVDQNQKNDAYAVKKEISRSGLFSGTILTKITKFVKFYEAENYHRDYYDKNKDSLYSKAVIVPKLEKLNEVYKKLNSDKY